MYWCSRPRCHRERTGRTCRIRLELPSQLGDVDAQVLGLVDLVRTPTSASSWRCVSTLPACLIRIWSSLYSWGVRWTSAPSTRTRPVHVDLDLPEAEDGSRAAVAADRRKAARIRASNSPTAKGFST